MQWGEAWQRAQRARCRGLLIATVIMAFMLAMMVGIGVVIEKTRRPNATPPVSRGFGIAAPGLPIALMFLAPAALLCWRYRRERLVLTRIPVSDGHVCPKCRALLAEDSDRLRCPRGHGAFTPTAVRGYWEQYPYPNRQRAPDGAGAATDWSGRWESIRWTLRNRPAVTGVALVVVWLATSLAITITTSFSFVFSALKSVHMLFFSIALLFVMLGWKRRKGDALHCATCDYERAAGAVERCPECGSRWTLPGALTRGTAVRSRSMLWTGGLMLSLYAVSYGGLIFMDLIGKRSFRASVTPTWVLFKTIELRQDSGFSSYRQWPELGSRSLTTRQQERLTQLLMNEIIEAPRGFVVVEWAVMGGLTLTGDQTLRFFERLLDKRDRSHLSRGDMQWMQMQINAGTLPDALRERYHEKPPPG